MSYVSHGFLTESLGEIRHAVHNRYKKHRKALIQLNEQCVAAQYELQINTAQHLLGAAFFVRTIASSQAAVILLEAGMISQAKAVLRSALESLFSLAALEARPELAIPLAQSQEANKRSLADKMLQWQSKEMKASREAQISEEELLELKSNKARGFSTWQLAEYAGMTDWYRSLYTLLSFPAHATVSDLIAHLVTDIDGNIIELKSEPEVEGQESTWGYIIEIQLRAAKSVVNMFGVSSINIEVHENALRDLF